MQDLRLLSCTPHERCAYGFYLSQSLISRANKGPLGTLLMDEAARSVLRLR